MGAERRFTDSLARFFPRDLRRVKVGIGDDAAVVVAPPGRLVLTVDPVVVGVHCTAETAPSAVGRKAVNRNLSDLAAMGAVADWLLVSVLMPAGFTSADRTALFRGIRAAADRAGAQVVGGDVGSTKGPLTVTITAIGHLTGTALTRDLARVGDRIHVTGPLGGSILGRHLAFVPRLEEGQRLARMRGIGAVIDVSDGLALDLRTLLARSSAMCGRRLGAELYEEVVPIARSARRLAVRTGRPALEHALSDGEDHELLFTARRFAKLPKELPDVAQVPIGTVLKTPGLWLVRKDGTRERVPELGYEHEI